MGSPSGTTTNIPTERDALLPSYEASQRNSSEVIYTIRGPSLPAPPPVSETNGESAIPPPATQTWVVRRWVRRDPTFCGTLAKVVLGALAIVLLAQPILWFWKGIWHTDRKPSPIETLQPLPNCLPFKYTRTKTFTFDDPSDFTLKEYGSRSVSSVAKHIGGRVIMTRGHDGQASKIEASIVYGSSEYDTTDGVGIDVSGSSLIIDTSSVYVAAGLDQESSCLAMDIHLVVAPYTKLDALHIYVEHLGIEINEGFSLNVGKVTDISALSRDVKCSSPENFSSREAIVNVASGSITGQWALLDLLSLKTQSGRVDVAVVPGRASPSRPSPANLVVYTQSGSCTVSCLMNSNTPERDYRTEVISQSGSISGFYIHGSQTLLKSSSGSISADITPYDGATAGTSLVTEAHSGKTTLNIHEPYRHDVTFAHMGSSHSSVSGGVELHYPKQWEGTIEGNVISGSLDVHGDGVRIIEESKIGPIKRIKAVRGDGTSHIAFKSTSGSAYLELD